MYLPIRKNIKDYKCTNYISVGLYWSNVLTERFSIPNKNQTKEDTSF